MKHLLLVYVPQNNCFYYLSNTNTPNTVFYYLLFQIVSEMLFVFPNSPLVAKKHYLYLNSQIVKYQIAALTGRFRAKREQVSCLYVYDYEGYTSLITCSEAPVSTSLSMYWDKV